MANKFKIFHPRDIYFSYDDIKLSVYHHLKIVSEFDLGIDGALPFRNAGSTSDRKWSFSRPGSNIIFRSFIASY